MRAKHALDIILNPSEELNRIELMKVWMGMVRVPLIPDTPPVEELFLLEEPNGVKKETEAIRLLARDGIDVTCSFFHGVDPAPKAADVAKAFLEKIAVIREKIGEKASVAWFAAITLSRFNPSWYNDGI